MNSAGNRGLKINCKKKEKEEEKKLGSVKFCASVLCFLCEKKNLFGGNFSCQRHGFPPQRTYVQPSQIHHTQSHQKATRHIKGAQFQSPPFICPIFGSSHLARGFVAAAENKQNRRATVHFEATSIQRKTWTGIGSFQIDCSLSAKQVEVGLRPLPSRVTQPPLSARPPSCSTSDLLCCRGNKPANSPKGQPPDADGHSSVTDLANSLTGDMVMVRLSASSSSFFLRHIILFVYFYSNMNSGRAGILCFLIPTTLFSSPALEFAGFVDIFL